MNFRARILPLALSSLLAACASAPSQSPSVPAHKTAVTPPPTPVVEPTPASSVTTTTESPVDVDGDVWDRLRNSFALDDCDSDPAVEHWAKRFTHSPRRFESQLKTVLPRLVYVEKIASRYDVPGEFALLPWVESHFQPVPGKRRRPAGMWQIMPVTAGAMGLRVDGHYDGRMDIPAAANAVMKLLAQYHDQFDDWRVADYAYNAGEFAIRRIIRKHGMPPASPTIPKWPVRKVTREHLTKLLAIACVVREPSRFHVTLPTLPEERHLVKVDIPHSMSLARAADHAGLSTETLKHLNSAFRGKQLDSEAASYLMLPAGHAEQFKNATQQAGVAPHDGVRDAATHIDNGAGKQTSKKAHTVQPGDSLWKIARTHHVRVTELKRWNHLSGNTLKPGQKLKLHGDH